MTDLRTIAPILDAMPEIVHVYDSEWRWQYINPAAADWLRSVGRDPDALIGRRVWDEFPDRSDEVRRAAERAVRENREVKVETREDDRELETRIIPHAGGVISLTRDVTEERREERRRTFLGEASRLFAENRPLTEMLDAISEMAVSTIADYAVAYVIDSGGRLRRAAMAHADPDRLPLMREFERVAPLHESDSTLQHLLGESEPLRFPSFPIERFARGPEHERVLRELGTASVILLPLSVQGRPVGGMSAATVEGGRPGFEQADVDVLAEVARRAGLSIAIARAHEAEREARRRAEEGADAVRRLAAIVEWSDDAIIGMDLEGTITSWNRAAERMYGYTAREIIGRPISVLVPPQIENDVPGILSRLRRGERVEHYETMRMAKDGRRLDISLTVSPIRDDRGNVVGASKIARDITERKRAAEDLRAAKEAAQADAAKLKRLAEENEALYEEARRAVAARDDMLAFVSHDLLNLLVLIKWNIARLREGAEADAASRADSVKRIGDATEQMDRLIQDLLTVSKLEAGQLALEPTGQDPARLVREACDMVAGFATEQGLQLAQYADPELPDVRVDRRRMLDVLQNLLGNAMKFTPEGGRIEVRAKRAGDAVRFEVADTGIGISPEDLPHIFDRFWHAERSGDSGAGLGLAICRGIVESHDGRIWAESEPERGSTFYFTLPVIEPEDSPD